VLEMGPILKIGFLGFLPISKAIIDNKTVTTFFTAFRE